ncbi:hypothetical protein AgCh_027840 [Apium graveolens]
MAGDVATHVTCHMDIHLATCHHDGGGYDGDLAEVGGDVEGGDDGVESVGGGGDAWEIDDDDGYELVT